MLQKTKKELEKKFAAREKALKLQREALPLCSAAIRNVHKNKLTAAKQKIAKIRGLIKKMEHVLKKHPDLIGSTIGIIYQEYAELRIYLSFLQTGTLPKLNVPEKYFVTGLADAIGELKRYVLELLSEGKLKDAVKMEEKLEDLYYQLSSLNYPNSIVPGLKRKQDVARNVLNELHKQIISYKLTTRK